jgi:hypothetical protein
MWIRFRSALGAAGDATLTKGISHHYLVQDVDHTITIQVGRGIPIRTAAALTKGISHRNLVQDVHHPITVRITGYFDAYRPQYGTRPGIGDLRSGWLVHRLHRRRVSSSRSCRRYPWDGWDDICPNQRSDRCCRWPVL